MSLFHKNFSWCSHIPVLFSTPDWRTGRRTFHTVRFPAGQGAMASSRACSSYRAQRGSLYALLLSHAIRCVPDYILSWLVRLFTRLPTLDAPSGRDGMIPAFWSLFSPLLWVRSGVHCTYMATWQSSPANQPSRSMVWWIWAKSPSGGVPLRFLYLLHDKARRCVPPSRLMVLPLRFLKQPEQFKYIDRYMWNYNVNHEQWRFFTCE